MTSSDWTPFVTGIVALLMVNIVLTSCVLSHQLTDQKIERINIENAFLEEVNKELERKYDGQVWVTCHRIANSDKKHITCYGPDWHQITQKLEEKGCSAPSGQ